MEYKVNEKIAYSASYKASYKNGENCLSCPEYDSYYGQCKKNLRYPKYHKCFFVAELI